RSRAAVGRRDGDDLYDGDARLAVDRVALRQSDAACFARQGASAGRDVTMTTLSQKTLEQVTPAVARPAYDPRGIGMGIVHLGIGAFHRAHQAIYTDDALAHERGAWGICGVSLRSPDVRDRMMPQDGLYTAVEKSPEGVQRRVIGSVREILFLGAERGVIDARLVNPATRIVTLTVTEKGYCHDPATGRLNFEHHDIVHDLAHPRESVSVVGVRVAALE